ncbi:ba3-type terminal oxidase subunit CbaD [Halalkaliarchaeum sp. AArc-CO]|uniref:hypothetical protein n=1 Tax=unclassified Halalkaliarchaeum TaxID=2678344 RepID=UPI00217D22BF|nr:MULTISPECIES: hypothetical protein [unclassified Halalkaliarchaeum]MDR5671787.1 hypothetical protein [Halalkaliarchaeum sp. AArc-GB]UWG51283.1 ba3-type terminal oxidase subunit CbaD [Halalkaliarchaeum sp. AArc-CO]
MTNGAASQTSTESALVDDSDGEEFDPKGTLALIMVYFGILVVMWFFMYFVEFLGNDLVVIG